MPQSQANANTTKRRLFQYLGNAPAPGAVRRALAPNLLSLPQKNLPTKRRAKADFAGLRRAKAEQRTRFCTSFGRLPGTGQECFCPPPSVFPRTRTYAHLSALRRSYAHDSDISTALSRQNPQPFLGMDHALRRQPAPMQLSELTTDHAQLTIPIQLSKNQAPPGMAPDAAIRPRRDSAQNVARHPCAQYWNCQEIITQQSSSVAKPPLALSRTIHSSEAPEARHIYRTKTKKSIPSPVKGEIRMPPRLLTARL